ncbi:CDP-glycerol glycerophosphotransferase family protein [Streptomyces sp. NPDC092296]|uniref:bifunctional glycosyltransferase/CDP-glycerol:glycerophosphate glycerophosphotransferase n=1 Tax=Streptomyces sp. NPDC092296 TaxID=3366012 RepID=UPI00382B2936
MAADAYEVTIVVPVYNVEDYLQECLDSLAAQTVFDKCQIVLVDDGSTDSSGVIAKQFAEQHGNVLLHVQENHGLGATRNIGMGLAQGRYITFCDSDDILPEDAIESLWRAIVEFGAPISFGYMETFPRKTPRSWRQYFGDGDKLLSGLGEVPELILNTSACNKLFDLAFVREKGLRFAEGVHFEDAFFVIPALLEASGLALVDKTVYLYRKREGGGSIMDAFFTRDQNYWDHLTLEQELSKLLPQLDEVNREALERYMVRSYQGFVMRAGARFEEEELRRLFAICRETYRDVAVENILAAAKDTLHRIGFAAILMDDFELYARPGDLISSVYADDGQLYLEYPVPDEIRPLMKVDWTSATVEQVLLRPELKAVEIAGHFQINGLRLLKPLGTQLSVRVRGSGITERAECVLRHDRKTLVEGEPQWSGFSGLVPLKKLREGTHDLRLVFDTPSGQTSRMCRISVGALRGAKTLSAGNRRMVVLWGEGGGASLMVRQGSGGAEAAKRWQRELARKDLKHALQRKPFALARLVRLATRPLVRNKDIWIVGERRDTAQDNSLHLFRHLRKVVHKRDAYYIIEKGSKQRSRLNGLGNVVNHGSLRHKFLMLHASALINSYDIDAYMLPRGWDRMEYLRHLKWRTAPRRIFLQHGVIHTDVSGVLHRARTNHDLFVASAEPERAYIADDLQYGDGVKTVGLPRYDALVPDRGHRKVLFMPTWRTWLASPSSAQGAIAAAARFEGSAFHTFMAELFASETLRDALTRNGYTFEFLPHYEMHELTRHMLPEGDSRFRFVDQTTTAVQDALRQCDLFVTDWSSVAFDVAYLGTPMVYAQFDAEEFWSGRHYRKGYFDAREQGFGPVAATVEETADAIARYLDGGCVREAEYTARAEAFFPHRDQNNSARVIQAINDLTSGKTKPPRT